MTPTTFITVSLALALTLATGGCAAPVDDGGGDYGAESATTTEPLVASPGAYAPCYDECVWDHDACLQSGTARTCSTAWTKCVAACKRLR